MAFSKTARPKRVGAYVDFEPEGTEDVLPAQGSVVALGFQHNWGPMGLSDVAGSWAAWKARFGENIDAPVEGEIAARGAFLGENILNRGGAGGVLPYRVGTGAVKASRVLSNTTPTAAATVQALYEGTKGNEISLTTQPSAAGAGQDDLIVLNGANVLERYTFDATDVAGLAAVVNDESQWIRFAGPTGGDVSTIVTGTALGQVTNQALTGGTNGTVDGAAWTAMRASLETARFALLALADLTDDVERAAWVAWTQAQNDSGHRHMLVLGGALGETLATAIGRAQTINDPNVVTIGGGSVVDDTYGQLSTAQLAPRIAGILASRGETKSITMARLGGLTDLIGGATSTEIDQAYDAGLVVLARDTAYPAAPIRVEKGLTTFTSRTDKARPYKVFSNPKFVRTMHGIENESVQLGASPGFAGELAVNAKTRLSLKGEIEATILSPRETSTAIRSGWSVDIDQDPPPTDDDEFVAYQIGLRFGRVAEQIFLTIQAG